MQLSKWILVASYCVALVSLSGTARSQEPRWALKAVDGPTPRAVTAMVYDSCRGVTVLYAGMNDAAVPPTQSRDTWEWDGIDWSLRSTDGPPGGRLTGLAFDPGRCVTVLFGGNDVVGVTYLRETWEWDGATWTRRCQNCLPTQRHQPGMAYNSARQRVVIFGGWSGGTLLNDVWEWDGTTWTPVATTGGPTRRTGVGMAYDPIRDRIVAFGGRLVPVLCGTMSGETWELDMSVSPAVWTLVTTANAPSPREGLQMVYDPTDSTMKLFGGSDGCANALGDTWVYNGIAWEQANVAGPSARHLHAMAFDGLRSEFVLFGGLTTWNRFSLDPADYNGETWSYSANQPPTADAVVEQLTGIGAQAVVRLDGSGSSDPDNLVSELTFTWTVDAVVVCDGTDLQCATIEVPLSFGAHEVVLRVTDPDGAFDEATTNVTLDPSMLSVFEIDKVKVEFGQLPPRLRIKGQIGLPFGVNFTELFPMASAAVDLAGINVLPATSVAFDIEPGEPNEWTFRDPLGQVSKFDINWEGTRFAYHEPGFPVKLKSQVITTSETVLGMKFDMADIGGAFSVDIGALAMVDVDAAGDVFATVVFEVEEPGEEITLTLPFGLTDTTVITFSGALTGSVLVGDYLKGSVGRFRLEAIFDAALLPVGSGTIPRTLAMDVTVGTQAYPGGTSLDPDDLRVKQDKWQEAKRR